LCAIIFLWLWRNGALTPTKEKSILIVVSFFLSFLGCGEVPKKAPHGIMLCDCLALLVLSFVAIERARTKKAFLLRFIFAVDQQLACTSEFICPREHAGPVHTGGACAGDARAEAFVSC